MQVIKHDGVVLSDVKEIKINGNGLITINGVSSLFTSAMADSSMTIKSEETPGFLALSHLAKYFEHMDCWRGDGGQCPVCPVGHNGVCGITTIKNAAVREGMAEGTINETEGNDG